MNLNFYMPVKVICGVNCISKNQSLIAGFNGKAFIVTGKNSGRKSGALDDIVNILNAAKIEFEIFDGIKNNPDFENIQIAANCARNYNPGFIIGIGGGSPLDAAKAVAVMAVNKDLTPIDLYSGVFINKPLPIIAIPTTAGTGSEVTQYSILTRYDIESKKSFSSPDIFPKIAFLDPTYTLNLSFEITINTALDAVSHAVEGYLSKNSDIITDTLALQSLELVSKAISKMGKNSYENSIEFRENLLYASTLAGIVIAHTGTNIVHSLGYSLTYFKNIPHGRANGYLLVNYLKFNYSEVPDKIKLILTKLGFNSIDDFELFINKSLGIMPELANDEISKYVDISVNSPNILKNPKPVTRSELIDFFKN